MKKVNIIADIAGRYNELMKLLDIMPPADEIVLVGDLVDRGPDSKKVVEWAMNGSFGSTPVITLKGNHEDMFVGMYTEGVIGYPKNGQLATLKSYGVTDPSDLPSHHVKWMEKLPLFYKQDGLLVTHAPWLLPLDKTNDEFLNDINYMGMKCLIWNRDDPKPRDGVFQVFGHNMIMTEFQCENKTFAACIDDCANGKLTGMSWPDCKIFQVDYE